MSSYDFSRTTPEMRRWFEETLRMLAGRLDAAPSKRVECDIESGGAAPDPAESQCQQSRMY
jgi:hypothetical protein